MTDIMIKVAGASATRVRQTGLLTTGMVGATVTVEFDSTWEGLTKTAVFRGSGVVRDVLDIGSVVKIPPEVLTKEGDLYAGVEGRDSGGEVVIPTVWVRAANVHPGANASGDTSTNPALPVWAQIQAMIGDLAGLETVDKSSIVAAINEALSKGGSAVDEDAIAQLVEEYLAEYPPEVEVTPEEIGAIAAPATAQVGQTIVVTEVDEDGKPVSWECVDMVSSDGEGWDYEKTIAIEEEVASVEIDAFDDGTPLALKKIELVAIVDSTEASIRGLTVLTDLPHTANAGCLTLSSGTAAISSGTATLCRLEGEIVDGVVNGCIGVASPKRYVNYYNEPLIMTRKNVGLSFGTTYTPYLNKATCFNKYTVTSSAGNLAVGSAIVVRGVRV